MSRPSVPICSVHSVEMRCNHNDHLARLDASFGPYEVWSGDEYICPIGKERVVVGFAQLPIAQHFESDFHKFAENPDLVVKP